MTEYDAESRRLRVALGQFATGVTIVTTLTAAGEPAGLTVNSFTSLSLEPPLVLWNLGRQSVKHRAFDAAGYFAVNVLRADQEAMARAFARPGGQPFSGIAVTPGVGDVPVLPGCIACFECRLAHRYPGGDHDMLIGEVLRFQQAGGEPLLFHGGRFGHFAPSG